MHQKVCEVTLEATIRQSWTMSDTKSKIGRKTKRIRLVLAGLLLFPLSIYGFLFATTGYFQLSSAMVWLDADIGDINRFPSRVVQSSTPSELQTALDESTVDAFGRLDLGLYGFPGQVIKSQDQLNNFLIDTQTTALLVLHQGVLVHEWYAPGLQRDSIHTSFSVSKSFLSTLLGLAIRDGYIKSIDDPITDYIPELMKNDPRFSEITLKHLVTMTSGLAYVDKKTPFSDPVNTYYSTNLRKTALSARITEQPGKNFLYNNYNPLLLGMALERATGQKVTEYMSKTLWGPLCAEADASWSLDSNSSGFEKMESGFNARAVDFARFGLLFLNKGVVDGKQVVPEQWVDDATKAINPNDPNEGYKYFWRLYPNNQFAAAGNKGQYVLVAPDQQTVIVRLGSKEPSALLPLLVDLGLKFDTAGE